MIDWKKYILVFIITALLFVTGFLLSNYFGNRKISQLESIQDTVSTDILSSELRFALLERSSCDYFVGDSALLSEELGTFGRRLAFMEEQLGVENKNVKQLKKFYSLLQIKDYLLTLNLSEKCDLDSNTILYFYSNDCEDCNRQGYILTELREKHHGLRIYSFDYNLDTPALNTLISVYGVIDELPVLVINEEVYSGFKTIEDIKEILPELKLTQDEEGEEEDQEGSEGN